LVSLPVSAVGERPRRRDCFRERDRALPTNETGCRRRAAPGLRAADQLL